MPVKNIEKLPQEVVPLLQRHVEILVDVLGERLVGVYVHGSAAMGGFTPRQSDLDYLAVVSSPLIPEERKRLANSLLAIYGRDVPAKGVEMSIIAAKFAGSGFRYPTPYEFHMGTQAQIRFHGLPHNAEVTDPDLAAHFTITKRRGLCVYGEPVDDIFAEIPTKYYLASIALDCEDSYNNIQEDTSRGKCVVPQYAVLNFCRVLAFINQDLIASKIEGGDWGLRHLPEKYRPVILAALQEYGEPGSSEPVDLEILKEFATYAMNIIRSTTCEDV
jgi:predicted nucleotidyltransferase